MRILLSPAKKMRVDTDSLAPLGLPVYLEQARELMNAVQKLSLAEAKTLWKCNDQLAALNYERFAHMDLERQLTPAVLAYEGLAYQYMAPGVMTEDMLSYLQAHLRILSGFYGVLRPFDGVVPYRLEMQAKLSGRRRPKDGQAKVRTAVSSIAPGGEGQAAVLYPTPVGDAAEERQEGLKDVGGTDGWKDLYAYWGDLLYRGTRDEDGVFINLASKEYAKAVEKYITPADRFITVEFCERVDGKLKQKGTFAKMARGEMVRFLAEHQIKDPARMREFQGLGYRFAPEESDEKTYIFCK